jgi:hypothetical protein
VLFLPSYWLILYGLMLGRILCLSTKRMMQSVELYGQFYWAARVSGEDNVLGKANGYRRS